jgi:ADP-ribose pyrophosphatase YjhB (NUDIX family)
MSFQLTYDIVEACNAIKAAAIAAAKKREAEEIARGVKLFGGPLATMEEWFRPVPSKDIGLPADKNEEDIVLWQAGSSCDPDVIRCQAGHVRFNRGTTDYLVARRTWDAFVPTRHLIMESDASEEDFRRVGPVLFPWTFGVLTLLRRYDANREPHILVGIRSKELAGRHVGTVSFPGGLVRPKESIERAARRQMREECGIEIETMESGFAIGLHPNAPSTTFMCVANTTSHVVSDSFEWKGGKAVWTTEESVKQALNGNTEAMIGAFRKAGLDVNEGVPIAPDAAAPARLLLNHVYPTPISLL